MRESLYERVNVWVRLILNHVDTRAILPRCEGSCMIHRSKCNKKNVVLRPYATGIKEDDT